MQLFSIRFQRRLMIDYLFVIVSAPPASTLKPGPSVTFSASTAIFPPLQIVEPLSAGVIFCKEYSHRHIIFVYSTSMQIWNGFGNEVLDTPQS